MFIQVKALYVKNIPENTATEQLKELFQRHGEVTKVVMPPAKSGGKRDFGFIHYAERSSALKAVKETEKYEINGPFPYLLSKINWLDYSLMNNLEFDDSVQYIALDVCHVIKNGIILWNTIHNTLGQVSFITMKIVSYLLPFISTNNYEPLFYVNCTDVNVYRMIFLFGIIIFVYV